MRRLRNILFFLSLLYLTLYIPIAAAAYLPQWFRINCSWHPRCERIGLESAYRGIDELTRYFLHQGELEMDLWSAKEKTHLGEVRGMFDKMLLVSLLAVLGMVFTFERKPALRYASVNLLAALSLIAITPFFGYFWRDIFHPLIFDNDLWKNTRSDLSYYIMPRIFFLHTFILAIVSSCALNLAIRLALARRKSAPPPD